MSFACSITSSSLSNLNKGATGPKVSSLAIIIFFETSVKSVGSKKDPPKLCLLPPKTKLAPFDKASAICSSTLSTASSVISGPVVTLGLKPFPILSFVTARPNFSANSS